ncbi:hypothetical protein B0H13DRAFT_1620939, partial [Mycena leptocephala]
MWPPAPFAEDSKTKRDGAVAAEQSTIAADVESTFPVWASLTQMEKQWAYYQPFLAERGYMLRPRYRPGWDPAMLNSQQFPWKAEESLSACGMVLDATRVLDGGQVVLKIVEMGSMEEAIAAFLAGEHDAHKHVLPLLEVIPIYDTPEWGFLVMPCMRQCNYSPYFATVGEVAEFVEQVLEGLVFLHGKNIAHRDICTMNIVVDPSHMIPGGSHFLNQSRAPNGVDYIHDYTGDDSIPHFKKSRTEAGPMHYYFIDFGVSVHFPSFEARTHVTGEVGRLREHNPEIS